MHIAFWVLSTHYQLDLVTVSTDDPFKKYSGENLKWVHEETLSFAKALAAKYKKEVLPELSGQK